jgi:3-deoxy-D-manno-octulosonic-acid transferase
MHCASLGEFEQGRPLIELIKTQKPETLILLTFFSPSGYEIRKQYPLADLILYLPVDTSKNARLWLDAVQPDLALWVKYEYWYHYLAQLHHRRIPVFLVSAVIRNNHLALRWYGGLYRVMLRFFSKIFVQEDDSAANLKLLGIYAIVSGDTRVDRVGELSGQPFSNSYFCTFCEDDPVFICGSTWPEDERILSSVFKEGFFKKWKLVIAPHEVQSADIQRIKRSLKTNTLLYDRLESYSPAKLRATRVLIVNTIGVLSKLYRYGKIAYIGGGFGKAIHNILEPAAYGLPVLMGPNHKKFVEATRLIKNGGAFLVKDAASFEAAIKKLEKTENWETASKASKTYIIQNQGATNLVYQSVSGIIT